MLAGTQFAKVAVAFQALQASYGVGAERIGLALSIVGTVGLVFGVTVGLFSPRIGYRDWPQAPRSRWFLTSMEKARRRPKPMARSRSSATWAPVAARPCSLCCHLSSGLLRLRCRS